MTSQRATEAPLTAGLPVFGAAFQIKRAPYTWWPEQLRRHGPVFRVRLPISAAPWIALAGEDANALLAKRGRELFSQERTYPRGERVLGTNLHPSITEGALQHHLRKQLGAALTPASVRPHIAQMVGWVRDDVARWRAGDTFNVTQVTARLGLNCSAIFATGAPLSISSEAIRRYAIAYTGVVALGWPKAFLRWPSMRRAVAALDGMIEAHLDARLSEGEASGSRPRDFFDAVLEATLLDGSPLPKRARVVWGQVPFKNMGVYAGRVIHQVLYQIVHRAEALACVLPEVDAVFGAGDAVTLEALMSMTKTRAVMREALRVHPVAAALQRVVIAPFEFGGYRFEPGDAVFFPISATHFMPEHFDAPERFRCDRFADGAPTPAPYVYNPFGLGHHSCLARGLFEAMALSVLGPVLRRWRLSAPYAIRTTVDALPGPWSGHRMTITAQRSAARGMCFDSARGLG